MITAQYIQSKVDAPFSLEFRIENAIKELESELAHTIDRLNGLEYERKACIENIKMNGVARTFTWEREAYLKCVEVFEPRGFVVDYHAATGITLHLK